MKTKIILLFLLFLIATSIKVVAQEQNNAQTKKWEVGLQINTPERKSPLEEETENSPYSGWSDDINLYHGISGNAKTRDATFALSITGIHFLKNDNFLRFKAGFNEVNIHLLPSILDTSGYYNVYEASKKRNDLVFSLGFGRNIVLKQFSLHTGFELPFTYYGKANVHSLSKGKEPTSPNYYYDELTGTIFNSYSIGIGNFSGVSYQIKKISIGAEISFAFLYNKRIGVTHFLATHNDYINNVFTISDYTINPKISNFDMSKIKGSLILTYSF